MYFFMYRHNKVEYIDNYTKSRVLSQKIFNRNKRVFFRPWTFTLEDYTFTVHLSQAKQKT